MKTKDIFFNEARERAKRRKLGLPYRKPQKTFAEIAEMLGISEKRLKTLVQTNLAPKASVKTRNRSYGLNYYDEDEFKKWWDNLSEDKKGEKK